MSVDVGSKKNLFRLLFALDKPCNVIASPGDNENPPLVSNASPMPILSREFETVNFEEVVNPVCFM